MAERKRTYRSDEGKKAVEREGKKGKGEIKEGKKRERKEGRGGKEGAWCGQEARIGSHP